jgi:hypothetical protein
VSNIQIQQDKISRSYWAGQRSRSSNAPPTKVPSTATRIETAAMTCNDSRKLKDIAGDLQLFRFLISCLAPDRNDKMDAQSGRENQVNHA